MTIQNRQYLNKINGVGYNKQLNELSPQQPKGPFPSPTIGGGGTNVNDLLALLGMWGNKTNVDHPDPPFSGKGSGALMNLMRNPEVMRHVASLLQTECTDCSPKTNAQ
tara:strand:+ start:1711 stop:2034 length:324 start_codon:yes stop_codon:yes gene_type:complete